MSVQRRLDELMREAKALGLESQIVPTARGNKISKDDVCRVLRNHYLKRDYPNGMPYTPVLKPMLCERFEEIEVKFPEIASAIWQDGSDWVLNPKINGCRAELYLTPVGSFMDTRNISVKTFRNEEYHGQLLFQDFKSPVSVVLDCEVLSRKARIDTGVLGRVGIITEGELQATTAILALEKEASLEVQRTQSPLDFWVFDILEYNGMNLRHLPLKDRKALLDSVLVTLSTSGLGEWIHGVEWVTTGKREYYQNLLASGKEGAVAKHLESPYIESESRTHRKWVKLKRILEVDAFVCGWTPADKNSGWADLIGGLEMGVYLTNEDGKRISDKPHVIATITNIEFEERKRISLRSSGTGELYLDPSYYGRVAEVVGQAVSARKRALSHARALRWRLSGPDRKDPDQCEFPESVLNANIL